MPKEEGPHYRFGKLEFFAYKGMITVIDDDDAGSGDSVPAEAIIRVSVGEFMKRAIAVRMGADDRYEDEVFKARQLLENAKTACLLAKAQGDPTDALTVGHVTKHRKRRASLVMPGHDTLTGGAEIKLEMPATMLKKGVKLENKSRLILP